MALTGEGLTKKKKNLRVAAVITRILQGLSL